MVKEITINGSLVRDIPSFYEEMNRVFMAGENWRMGNNLDAFNDVLHGGFGAIAGKEPVRLLWKSMEQSRQALGYEATRKYYEEKLQPGSPFNKAYFSKQLAALDNGTGKTYFDILLGIIADHPNITIEPVD